MKALRWGRGNQREESDRPDQFSRQCRILFSSPDNKLNRDLLQNALTIHVWFVKGVRGLVKLS